MTVTLDDGITVPVATLQEASEACRRHIDDHDLGASGWRGGVITRDDGTEAGRVSYNGRVWPPGGWRPGSAAIWPAERAR